MNLPDFKDITTASRQVATYSAMNPILWKTVICTPIGIVCSAIAPEPLNYFILAVSSLPLIVGCWGFIFFARADPWRLQSEGHIEKLEALSRIGDNVTKTQITLDPNKKGSSNSEEDQS
jgi:hypothetical protein